MAEHTKGRLRVNGWVIEAEGGPPGSTALVADFIDGERRIANARRLVACWNACEAFTTEAIEGGIVARCYEESFTLDGEGDESPVGQR